MVFPFSLVIQIQVINGVILISWRQAVLQKQIDYGAKLGHVVLSLAKMELENFFRNVMPVADYFDQSDMLIAVSRIFILLIAAKVFNQIIPIYYFKFFFH